MMQTVLAKIDNSTNLIKDSPQTGKKWEKVGKFCVKTTLAVFELVCINKSYMNLSAALMVK